MLNAGVHPVVPSRGSLGASGDLAPLAHLALPLVGEGWAEVGGEVLSGGEALRARGLEPVELGAKEGLALINGTQFMAAIGALVLARARAAGADRRPGGGAVGGGRARLAHAVLRPRSRRCGRIPARSSRPRTCIALLDGSEIVESHRWCGRVQDAYSLRCSPQVHGACRDAIAYARGGGRDRAERRHRQPAGVRRPRRGAVERQLPRRAGRDRAGHAQDRAGRAGRRSASGGSSGWSTRP